MCLIACDKEGTPDSMCPPEIPESFTPCDAEMATMLCCNRTTDAAAEDCEGRLSYMRGDPETEHCAALVESLLRCVSAQSCEALDPYVDAVLIEGMWQASSFAGLACEAQAVAVLDAGCEVVTSALK